MLSSGIFPEIVSTMYTHSAENELTAAVALRKAVQMKKSKKYEKSRKLFHHAIFLYPFHSDVLTCYGEFLEEIEKNTICADYFYQRALIVCPQHSKAIENSKRTRPLVDKIDEEQLSRINEKIILLNKASQNVFFKEIQKEYYFQQIYNTVAIEGNTMTLAEIRTFTETRVPVPNKSTFEHNEILGIVDALQYANESMLSKIGPITLSDILNMHKKIMGHVDPTQAGNLRKTQVYVGGHTPPAASDVYYLMQDFCKWFNSDLAEVHPVKLAALVHHKLAYIHPFCDGNGRIARLCMNLILMRAGYPSIIIRKQDSALYFDNLQIADEGDVRPFVRFIAQNTEEILDVYCSTAQCGASEESESIKT